MPDSTGRLYVSKGLIGAAPTPTRQYVSSYSKVPVLRFQDEIRTQVRRTAAFSILFAVESPQVETVEGTDFRRLMAKVLEQFGDDPHWETFMARAVSNHADAHYSIAVDLYEKARQCIGNDEMVRALPPWQKLVQQIEQVEELARREIRLQSGFMSEYHGS